MTSDNNDRAAKARHSRADREGPPQEVIAGNRQQAALAVIPRRTGPNERLQSGRVGLRGDGVRRGRQGGIVRAPRRTGRRRALGGHHGARRHVPHPHPGAPPRRCGALQRHRRLHLKRLAPDRYADLHHPGDAWSFDIFTQVGRQLRLPGDQNPLRGLEPSKLLAMGESQGAGAAHGDTYRVTASRQDDGTLSAERLADLLRPTRKFFMDLTDSHSPYNAGPQQRHVAQAALDHLDRWAAGGDAPPSASPDRPGRNAYPLPQGKPSAPWSTRAD